MSDGGQDRVGPGGRPPVEVTSLVGRDQELSEVGALLERTRLLTLAGPGGCGKTRLALRAVQPLAEVRWVELGSLDDPQLVAQRMAWSLGVPESPGRPITMSIMDAIAAWDGLIVLDNCEHLVDACAGLVAELLLACPAVRLLATSREPLGVAGEVSWPVAPLAVPATDSGTDIATSPAVALFLERSRSARPGFAPTDADLTAVAELCRRLDGIPLAIELAAARLRMLSPALLLKRLDDDLGVLSVRSRTAVARHRALLSTMDWSYELLTGQERCLFRALSVFVGRFDLPAAEAVGSAAGVTELLDTLSGLVDKSLVVFDGSRYRMLETVRRYASGRLDAAGESGDARDAHAAYIHELAQVAGAGLLGPDQRDWVARLGDDHANIAAALAWLYERGDALRGLDLAGRLGRYWWFAGHFTEGAAWLEAFLALPGADDTTACGAERARALHALGLATFWHETPDAGAEAARARFEAAAVIFRELGDEAALAAVLRDLGGYWKGSGDGAVARATLQESAAIAGRLGDAVGLAASNVYLGVVSAYEGDVAGARALLEGALPVLRERAGTDEVIRCLFFLACLDCDAGDPMRARTRAEELLTADVLETMPYTAGFALDGLSRIAAAEGQPVRALRLAGAARVAHERLGTAAGPAYDAYVRRPLQEAERALGTVAAERAYRAGRGMSVLAALAEALQPSPALAGGLSPREAEVLALVAEGLADVEVAGRLHVSPRTVGNHLSSVYRKLGVGSRTAAIRQARELGVL